MRAGRAEEAIALFRRAVEREPANAEALLYLAGALSSTGRPAEAVASYDRTLALMANHAAAWSSRGVALQALNRHADAIASFDRAIALEPDFADAHFNKSLALLAIGDYPRGQLEYEWRWKRSGAAHLRQNLGRPLWRGEDPQRRTILLHAEQGLGDTIQFARYAPLLARAGANVILETHPELKPLLARLDGVRSVIARGEARPAHDFHCPLGGLPMALKTELSSVPAEIPYVSADAERVERWRPRLEALGGPRVALVWAGNAAHANDRNRSVPLALLRALWGADTARFVSLQRDLRAGDAEMLAAAPVLHLGPELADFDDTAAVVAGCDLVITVDTSVAHLAGAMGRPVWVLLPFSCDWRWTAASDRSPWYPAARLYRQPQPGDWESVVARVVSDLPATCETAVTQDRISTPSASTEQEPHCASPQPKRGPFSRSSFMST